MKMKAIVTKLDIDRGVMVVLTKDRQFKRLPVPHPLPGLGDTIDIELTNRVVPWFRLMKSRWIAAAVAAMVLVGGLFGYTQASAAATYITLDMKASLQVAVDGKGRVKSVRPLNKNGADLAKNLHVIQKDVYTAIEDIMHQASRSGYFHTKQDNLVMAGVAKANGAAKYEVDLKKLRSVIYHEMNANHYPGYIVINDVKTSAVDTGGQTELSANKQILLEKARQSGVTLKSDMVKDMDMMEIVRRCNSSVQQLFPENSYQVKWPDESGKAEGTESEPAEIRGTPPAPVKGTGTGGMHRETVSGMPEKPAETETSHMQSRPGNGAGDDRRGMMQGMPSRLF